MARQNKGLLGLIDEIETKWAYHYCNEGSTRIDGKETEAEYRWVESKKLAARLKRIYRTEIVPLQDAIVQLAQRDNTTNKGRKKC